ncbi:MAG: hypothetical protein ACKVP7_21980 [Hyphomicrobiaceae bacterium]
MADDRELLKARFAVLGAPRNAGVSATRGQSPIAIKDTIGQSTVMPIPTIGDERIVLKIRRTQSRGVTGKITFSVHFIAELPPASREAVSRYGFGKVILYQKDLRLKLTLNVFRMLWRAFWLWVTRRTWRITVNDLVDGRVIAARDVLEMLDVENDIRGAAETFAKILRTAAKFGGEEVIDL